MEDFVDIASLENLPIESNDNGGSDEPKKKKRKSKKGYGDIETYVDRVKEDSKVNFVCKLKKPDGTPCLKKYAGPSLTNSV